MTSNHHRASHIKQAGFVMMECGGGRQQKKNRKKRVSVVLVELLRVKVPNRRPFPPFPFLPPHPRETHFILQCKKLVVRRLV